MNLFALFRATDPLTPATTPSGPSWAPFMGSVDGINRTATGGMPMDSRREITYFTRSQLLKKSRWLFNNMGLIRRMVNGACRYAIGRGISPIPRTGNDDFDEVLDKYFCDWADSSVLTDVRRRLSFWRMQKHVLRGMFRDGDAFALKAPAPDQALMNGQTIMGRPRIQWLESHRIGNAGLGNRDVDEEGFVDGVLSDPYGGALEYSVLIENPNPMTWNEPSARVKVPQDSMLHVFDPERASQCRGLPWIYHGENSALDILDLTALEKHAAKLHAAVAAAIKRKTADAGKGFTGDLTKLKGKNAQGQQKIIAFENFAAGAGILQLATDEEFQLFTSNRPSQTFAGFIDYLIRDIAWGFGVSPEFIWAVAGLGGPNARMILEDSAWFFQEIQDMMVELFCQPIYMWVIARGIERGEIIVPAGMEESAIYTCDWMGPSKVTIDQGKEGNLELERLANACATWEEYWAARGKSGKKMVRKRIDELADAMEYAFNKKGPGHEEGVNFDYVMALNKGGDGGPSGDPNAKPGFGGKPKPGVKAEDELDED